MSLRILIPLALALLAVPTVNYIKKQKRYQASLHRRYLLSLIEVVFIVLCWAEVFKGIDPNLDLPSLLLRSSALIVAVLGFAAQPVISNLISGLLISFQKPFEVGDRIIVEGKDAGIVEDVTLRHTVISGLDGVKIIIPNGELNTKAVTNFSYNLKDRRGVHLSFAVSYETEVEKAIEVVRDCVAASPYTLPVAVNGIYEDSGPVYFLQMADSSLILRTTIWISRDTNTNSAITDVNLRVLNAFRKYGIEIPYPYFNLVEFEGTRTTLNEEAYAERPTNVVRFRSSDKVHMKPEEDRLEDAVAAAAGFAELQSLDPHSSIQIELLTEESVDLIQRLMPHAPKDFWVDGTSRLYKIHIRAAARLDSFDDYKKMVDLSTSGKNDAVKNLNNRIMEAMMLGRKKLMDRKKKSNSKESFEWHLSDSEISETEIGRSILTKVANDVRISVTDNWVELIVLKKVGGAEK